MNRTSTKLETSLLCLAGVVCLAFVGYVGSYLYLSRCGITWAKESGLHGKVYLFVNPDTKEPLLDHVVMCDIYYPCIAIEGLFKDGYAPAQVTFNVLPPQESLKKKSGKP